MLVPALLQTSLLLWLAQQTLQGGVKPQSVSWGRVLPARGVGVGVKPGVAGALGALGSRYGTKAMKTGIGRYPAAHLGAGGYRALGLGGRGGLRQGGYGGQGSYGAALGTGMAMGTGFTNGLGLGHGGRRVYGGGLGTLPGYGALAGMGYPGARPGVSAADLGGPQMADLGQAVEDLKREKSKALGPSYGDRTLGAGMPDMRRSDIPTDPRLQEEYGFRPASLPHGRDIKSLHRLVKSSSLGPMTALDKQSKGPSLAVSQAQRGERYEPTVLERRGVRQQLPQVKDKTRSQGSSQVQSARDYDSSTQQNQRSPNCGSTRDLSDVLGINHQEHLGSEAQRSQGLVLQPRVGTDGKHLGILTPQAHGERSYQLPLSQAQDGGSNLFSVPQGQGTRSYASAVAEGQRVKELGLVAKEKSGPRIRGTVSVERGAGSVNVHAQGGGSYGPVIPGASETQSLGIASVERHEAKTFTADGQKVKHLSHAEHDVSESKALSIPGQTGRNDQATSYIGGPGNYLGGNLGAGGYGPGLGQGAYLGGAAGKLGAALGHGYGEGATGYLGAMAGNGYAGYGNGYGDGHGAGLGYSSELADGAENKSGKREALGTGGYAGQGQGAYGALGAGHDSTGGKYGGAQVPYGNAPVIPAGLEGDGGYPYPAQQLNLGAEGAKTANKYGYGAQLGATHDALGEPAGKYADVNGAPRKGYKG
ncbi:keratin, type II cytoskeletal 3 [Clinocottus analis]|uniref:keratin, type II cytoskeletal 3 n=1 Tax=Clinocottus analis TaxID=304258 RepID=UPI0035BF5303